MGAQDFQTTEIGQGTNRKGRKVSALQNAFDKAQDAARYFEGNRGYTGTIAEKDSFIHVDRGNLDARKALDYIWTAVNAIHAESDKERCSIMAKIPKKSREWARRWAPALDDKFGPAIAIEVGGKAAKEMKTAARMNGRPNVKVFVFAGMASC